MRKMGRVPKRKSRKKRRRTRRRPRRYDTSKAARARRKHRRPRHRRSRVVGHHERQFREAEFTNQLLTALLKQVTDDEHYHPRHHTKDPEYAFEDARTQEFRRGFNAPDTHFWRPPKEGAVPYVGNYPGHQA